jgi:hypothetical protein
LPVEEEADDAEHARRCENDGREPAVLQEHWR